MATCCYCFQEDKPRHGGNAHQPAVASAQPISDRRVGKLASSDAPLNSGGDDANDAPARDVTRDSDDYPAYLLGEEFQDDLHRPPANKLTPTNFGETKSITFLALAAWVGPFAQHSLFGWSSVNVNV